VLQPCCPCVTLYVTLCITLSDDTALNLLCNCVFLFQAVLESFKQQLEGDEIIHTHLTSLYGAFHPTPTYTAAQGMGMYSSGTAWCIPCTPLLGVQRHSMHWCDWCSGV
jgi:hypothetical protein